ncbi:MAG: ComEA family DNA-binding protein [Chitinophagaceae bacterium]
MDYRTLKFILIFIPLSSWAQLPSGEDYLPETEETETSAVSDLIEHLEMHIININTASWIEFQQVPFLTNSQINAIIEHRQQYGYFRCGLELQQIKEIRVEDIQKILPYVKFSLPARQVFRELLHKPSLEWQVQIQSKLEESKGYQSTMADEMVFLGNSIKESSRFKIGFGNLLKLQIITKKDAGERIKQSSTGFSLQYQNKGILQEIILGNYQLQFGQGLCIGNTIAFGKSASVMGIMRAGRGLRHTGSVNNSDFLKGSACHLKLGHSTHLWMAFSSKRTDAKTETDSNGNSYITAMSSNNLYRNGAEISNRNNIKRMDMALRAEYRHGRLQTGLTFSTSKNHALKGFIEGNKSDQQRTKAGFDLQYTMRNILFFQEIAGDQTRKSFASIQGALISLDKYTDISVLYRYYSKEFDTDNTNAIASGNGSNERACLIGYQMRAAKKVQLNAYIDLFRHPEKTFRSDAPSFGKDALIQLNYTEKNTYTLLVRFQIKENQYNGRESTGMREVETHHQEKLRTELSYLINKSLSISHRIEMNRYIIGKSHKSTGYLMYHNLSYTINKHLKIHSRLTVFNVSDYNSRIYAYENDLSSVYSMKAWQDRGISIYAIVQYHVNKIVQIKTKFATVRYSDIHSTGSGVDEISGQLFNEIKFELTLKI